MKPPSELGEDVVPVPPALTEKPDADRYCDLVLTGGVASGVVYPWAMLELARHFHFKNIGGTSVGAMAAALAAAAEYGRRTGNARRAFEVLRRLPGALAFELPEGRTRLLSLFQPSPEGKRLFELFVSLVKIFGTPTSEPGRPKPPASRRARRGWTSAWAVVKAYARELLTVAVLAGLLWAALVLLGHAHPGWLALHLLPWTLIALGARLVWALRRDVRAGLIGDMPVEKPKLGLCAGGTVETTDDRPALSQWLHDGIQAAAGLDDDAPLTFRDLWNAPDHAGAAPRGQAVDSLSSPDDRSINLEMVTSNVTHGRPFRLPLASETTRLFFKRQDLEAYFPKPVLDAMVKKARRYVPESPSDPPASAAPEGLLQLPGDDLPVVVAARLSLSFPLLFSAVPLYAIDSEKRRGARDFRRCWFSDGGLCSNFPVHLFDEAVPRWPTFGMWLGKRSPYHPDQPVWLPEFHLEGRGETWQRFDPEDPMTRAYTGEPQQRARDFLGGFLVACLTTAKDWGDRAGLRMPHLRKRVARLGLRPGEGELNIAMDRRTILHMAHEYGTAAGREFVRRYTEGPGERPAADWQEQRWVRWQTLIVSLRKMLSGFTASAHSSMHSVPLQQAIQDAMTRSPILGKKGDVDTMAEPLGPAQAQAFTEILAALQHCEETLRQCGVEPQPYRPTPDPELKVRPPL